MSPKDQKTMAQIYAFYDLQDAILKANRQSSRARKDVREKITKLMRLASTVRRSGGLRFLGGVDPIISAQETKMLVAA